jgi:hypothetical protein
MAGLVLLRQAREVGLSVAQEGDTLVIRGPKRAEPIARLLIENKPEVLAALAIENCGATLAEVEEERAAIVQHDGNIPRDWAEGLARLDPDHPPGDVPLQRWQCFVDDVGSFLDSPFCAAAAALGWGPYDLFGCNREKPFARVDHAGLLWLLNGNKLVALSENTATIEMTTGPRQTWRRKPNQPGRVLAWELWQRLVPAGEPQ